jgi:hypothetical protein
MSPKPYPNQVINKTIEFIYEQLSAWRDDPLRNSEHKEEKLNSQLCHFLNSKDEFPNLRFHHEEFQAGDKQVDISVHFSKTTLFAGETKSIYDPILVAECKRLYNSNKEYVTGGKKDSGGIQRFKLGQHGGKHDIAIMIGYIQDKSPKDWHIKINKWISFLAVGRWGDDFDCPEFESIKQEAYESCKMLNPYCCEWNNNEILGTLTEDTISGTASCNSTHSRENSSTSEIEIHHLWVVMNKE